jgi:hypothetical protein
MAIDADYRTALEDLIKVQRQLRDDGIEAALEKSRRGGHLWIFFERPVLARDARIYIYHVAGKLDVQVKGSGLSDGIEIFPKQDELRPEEFGNAIRAPLGVHWGARESRGWRYWYYGAEQTERRELRPRAPVLAPRGERRRIERRLQEAGVLCQSEVSLQYQTLAKRAVLRGVESGGATKEIGRYVTFCDELGAALPWLQPIDSVAVNGRHAVVVAPALVSVEVFRVPKRNRFP